MLGSVLFLLNKLNEMIRHFLSHSMPDVIDGQDTLLIIIGQGAYIIGYIGFWMLYAPRLGRWGKIALRLFCAGGIVLALGHMSFMSALGNPEYLFILVILGMLLLTIGLIWFGILNFTAAELDEDNRFPICQPELLQQSFPEAELPVGIPARVPG